MSYLSLCMAYQESFTSDSPKISRVNADGLITGLEEAEANFEILSTKCYIVKDGDLRQEWYLVIMITTEVAEDALPFYFQKAENLDIAYALIDDQLVRLIKQNQVH